MWKNYFLTGFRNLRRNRVYSIINIAGLSIGLASLLLVAVFARHELTYNRFFKDADRIVRVARNLNGEYTKSASTEVADQWLPFLPGIEEKIEKQYVEFKKWNRIITFATLLSILIATLGIIGMSVLQVAKRTKEIGIRKVCGASIGQILALLTRETGITVLTSNILALPVAWLISKEWLQGFAFRISPGVLLFSTAGLLMLLLTILTVAMLSWKTASDNPSLSLRDE